MNVEERVRPQAGQSLRRFDETWRSHYVPYKKVSAGSLAGALSILVVWLLNSYVLQGDPITGEVASAMTTILTFLVAYMVPEA